MKITTELSIPIKIDVLGKPLFNENIKIGEITNSYFKDNKLWITVSVDSKKIKIVKAFFKSVKALISLET